MTITLDIPADSLDQLAYIAQRSYNTTSLAYAVSKMADDHLSREGGSAKADCEGFFDPEVFGPPKDQPTPASGYPTPTKTPVAPGSWEEFSESITEMMESGDFDWAKDTLEGIRSNIQKRRCVSDAQRRAVGNIARSKGWTI
jgi:hypothetical protein